MIRNDTARKLMYDWHSGQASPLYAAASSGLVADGDALLHDCQTIDDPKDRARLLEWVNRQFENLRGVTVNGQEYGALPWFIRRKSC